MDIISQLSDDLLLRILSCVRTKGVAATSLLSKRWRSLWMLIPNLEYDDSTHIGDYKSFSQFVYRSLLSNKAPVLESLHLNLGADCPVIDIGLWIDIAVSRRVRELEISISSSVKGSVSVSLPSSLYSSETLETLRLISCVLLDVPVHVRLPALKTLSLRLVDYIDDTALPRLLSGCSRLEGLLVERYDGDTTTDVTVVIPSLQRLTMLDQNSGTAGRFVIDAPCLKYLNIKDCVLYNFRQIENTPELAEAHVEITHGATQKFLSALTSVRRLSLCLSLSEKHDSGCSAKEPPIGWKPSNSVPKCFLFSLEAFVWIGYKGRQGDRELATYVLKNAACLKTATFSPESTNVGDKYQMLKELASVPTASISSQLLFD
ncbi:hypothetical protein EUTSA_v10027384mg [Eutrema salsugineum]|uniref:FBD domain-containing protein n=1 Tax=Eutrema salsugineum TaxID=72664 RepID=V4P595_EUTSA|nr:hypothetical protein EUTSA_v10027384mg [Eutrema salsugineum]